MRARLRLKNFVVVARVEGAGQWRWRAGAELIGALHAPRFCLGVFCERRWLRRNPDPGHRDGAVGIRRVGGVGRAIGLDEGGHPFAERDAVVLRGPVGQTGQGIGVGFIDLGSLGGHELDQYVSRSGHGRRLGRGVRRGRKFRRVTGVSTLNRVDRIGHCDMHHRHAARPGVNGDVRGLQDVNRDLIPVGDGIRVRRGGAHRHEYSDRCYSNAPHGPLPLGVMNRDLDTFLRQCQGNACPDAARAASDQCVPSIRRHIDLLRFRDLTFAPNRSSE
jgi:hypothetical protein